MMDTDSASPQTIRALCLYQCTNSIAQVRALLEQQQTIHLLDMCSADELSLVDLKALNPQIVFLNLPMKSLGLLRWIAHLRATVPQVGILVLGAIDDPKYREGLLEQGADDFIEYDHLPEHLMPAVQRCLAKAGR